MSGHLHRFARGQDLEAHGASDSDTGSSGASSSELDGATQRSCAIGLVKSGLVLLSLTLICGLVTLVIMAKREEKSFPDENATRIHDTQIKQLNWTVQAGTSAKKMVMNRTHTNGSEFHVCAQNEEPYLGLCYKKCSLLTGGTYPVRYTAFSCCTGKPCGLKNSHMMQWLPLPCRGYDVSGEGSCPHPVGKCLQNEERFLGRCYKKCSVLTEGAYPYRSGPATCCIAGGLTCVNPFNDKTSAAFNVGGGAGEKDPKTLKRSHMPFRF